MQNAANVAFLRAMTIHKNDTILFQGDSITDAGRRRDFGNDSIPANAVEALGWGYAADVARALLADYPRHALQIHNRGTSGNRVTDMRDRWQEDCLDLKPDILSVLIGVNDTWHGAAKGTPENGVGVDAFDRIFRQLLVDTSAALPDVRLVICEPFTTEAGAVLELNFHPDIEERCACIRSIAQDVGAIFVPFQELFDRLSDTATAAYWAPDGVHPSPAGHLMMSRFWLETVLAARVGAQSG